MQQGMLPASVQRLFPCRLLQPRVPGGRLEGGQATPQRMPHAGIVAPVKHDCRQDATAEAAKHKAIQEEGTEIRRGANHFTPQHQTRGNFGVWTVRISAPISVRSNATCLDTRLCAVMTRVDAGRQEHTVYAPQSLVATIHQQKWQGGFEKK